LDATETFDVVIVGFDDRDEPPETRLHRAFGIEPATARQLLSRLPATVQRAVSRVRAEYFRRALSLIGAHAEIRDQDGARVASESERPPAAQAAGAPFAYAEPARETSSIALDDTNRAAPPARAQFHVDPMSRTQAPAAAPAPFPSLRAPANPTMREAPAPQVSVTASPRAPATATVFDAGQPAAGRAPAGPQVSVAPPSAPTVGVGAGWRWNDAAPLAAAPPAPAAPAPQPAPPAQAPVWSMPSGVFDPPPAAAPAYDAPSLRAPRDPSSVYDPAPQPGTAPAKRRPGALSAAVSAQPAPLPDFGFVAVEPPPSAAPESYELAEAVPSRHAASAAGITLDDDPRSARQRVLSRWEQPGEQSMVEPTPQRVSERAISRRPPREKPRPAARANPGEPHAAAEARAAAAPRARPPRASARPPARERAPQAAVAAPAPAQQARLVVGIPDRRSTGQTLGNADTRPFWETVGEALTLPFSGAGVYWIAAITAWSVAIAFFGFLANFMFLLGAIVMFFANTSLFGFACDYYRVCLWLPLTGDDKIERGPEFDPVRILNVYIKSGVHLTLFMIVSQLPVIAWCGSVLAEDGLAAIPELLLHPVTWLLFLLPSFYWPMGVALTALGNDFASIWNVPAGIRAITRAPLEYTAIVGIGVVAFFVSAIGLALFGSVLGVTGIVVGGTLGFPLALMHGIQGALMGHLARARGEIFE
jgi:hypothetical protein